MTVENLVFGAGTHLSGYIEFFDAQGNVISKLHMPAVGLSGAWFSKRKVRHHHFEGQIKEADIARVKRINFVGTNTSVNTLDADIRAIFKTVTDIKG